jgi:hypothetical protein
MAGLEENSPRSEKSYRRGLWTTNCIAFVEFIDAERPLSSRNKDRNGRSHNEACDSSYKPELAATSIARAPKDPCWTAADVAEQDGDLRLR